MKELRNYSLEKHNTFGLKVLAKTFYEISNPYEDLPLLYKEGILQKTFPLGAGSNILFLNDYLEKPVLHLCNSGLEILRETPTEVLLRVGAGKNWDSLVSWATQRNLYGIENLVAIPGNAGSAPIQNIGAYGAELKEVFIEAEGFDLAEGRFKTISEEQAQFGYRQSIFKRELKGKFLITSIVLRLSKQGTLKLHYKGVKEALQTQTPTPGDVAEAIRKIRWGKLPRPEELGNAGSFFKNPLLSKEKISNIKEKLPEIPVYETGGNLYKVPAGYLIDQAGWKGKRFGNVGTYKKQALVIVNYGGATGKEIYDFSQGIIEDIQQKFGIKLEREVNVIA